MKLGAVFPQTEIGNDPGAIREYAQAAESMGYNHIMAFDHVLGANAESRPGMERRVQAHRRFSRTVRPVRDIWRA